MSQSDPKTQQPEAEGDTAMGCTCPETDLGDGTGHTLGCPLHPRSRIAPPASTKHSKWKDVRDEAEGDTNADAKMIPIGVCRYCLKPEHPSGTICKMHPDLIPDVPVGCDGPFEDRPLIDGVQPKTSTEAEGDTNVPSMRESRKNLRTPEATQQNGLVQPRADRENSGYAPEALPASGMSAEPLANYLSKTREFSTQEDAIKAMEMGKDVAASLKAENERLRKELDERKLVLSADDWERNRQRAESASERVRVLEQALFKPYYTTPNSAGHCAVCDHHVPNAAHMSLPEYHHSTCALLADAKETKEEA